MKQKKLDPSKPLECSRVVEREDGCWVWTGLLSPKGYGVCSVPGVGSRRAHRVVWAAFHGPIEDGYVLDHLCRTRACINPDHLRKVTLAQNTTENSLSPSAKWKARTCCEKCGGPFTVQNSRNRHRMPIKVRRCVPCWNKQNVEREARRAAEALASGQ
jgi:hypothetical protein